jgi:hypothetical protein
MEEWRSGETEERSSVDLGGSIALLWRSRSGDYVRKVQATTDEVRSRNKQRKTTKGRAGGEQR